MGSATGKSWGGGGKGSWTERQIGMLPGSFFTLY